MLLQLSIGLGSQLRYTTEILQSTYSEIPSAQSSLWSAKSWVHRSSPKSNTCKHLKCSMPTFSLPEISCCAVQRPGGGVSRIWSLSEEQRLWGGANGFAKGPGMQFELSPRCDWNVLKLYLNFMSQYLIIFPNYINYIKYKLIGTEEKDRQQPLELNWGMRCIIWFPHVTVSGLPLITTFRANRFWCHNPINLNQGDFLHWLLQGAKWETDRW